MRRGRHGIEDVGAIDKVEVEQTVAVVIEDGHAAGHGFGQILMGRGAGTVGKLNA